MKRAKILAGAALAVSLMAPSFGHASEPIAVNCMLDGVKSIADVCVTTFDLAEDAGNHFISLLYTGGDFRPMTVDPMTNQPVGGGAGTRGTVEVTWLDSGGNIVVQYTCPTVAAQADYQPTSVVRAQCSETKAVQKAAAGTQTLQVKALTIDGAPATGIRMQGRLNLRPEGDLV